MSNWAAWAAAGVSLVGAGLAYLGARQGTRPERDAVTESRRDEWGRRFSTAIELLARSDPRDRAMGRGLLDALFESDLATADDRRIAQRLLQASVLVDVPVSAQRDVTAREVAAPLARAVDGIEFVEDNGDEGGSPATEEQG